MNNVLISILMLLLVIGIILLFTFNSNIMDFFNFKSDNNKYMNSADLHNMIFILERHYNSNVMIPNNKIIYNKLDNKYVIGPFDIIHKNSENITIEFIPLNKNITTNLYLFNQYGTYNIINNNINNNKHETFTVKENIPKSNDIFIKQDNNNDNIINIDSIINEAENTDFIQVTTEEFIEPDSDVNTTESFIDALINN